MEKFDSPQHHPLEAAPENLELLENALRAHHAAPAPQTREKLLEILKNCFVYVAVQDLPPHLKGVGTFVLQEDTPLVMLASTSADGKTRKLIFSDRAQVLARQPDADSIAMSAPVAARQALREGLEGLVIDPAGYWVEFTRAETEDLAREDAI